MYALSPACSVASPLGPLVKGISAHQVLIFAIEPRANVVVFSSPRYHCSSAIRPRPQRTACRLISRHRHTYIHPLVTGLELDISSLDSATARINLTSEMGYTCVLYDIFLQVPQVLPEDVVPDGSHTRP
ncbi:hypothetical protein BV22DRAFT_97636 [Leucogyrophana mollusca]|uniref:Uncharacterized protein n=1 Tax=Leucogyrophana mollusca TaxID=85980 RepID=A0ACB8BV35_9AGAM|nr:hypothetical protein BV22DRAFT_97636 [Leucogyrophana mollusca]